jgi:hypothetical protein
MNRAPGRKKYRDEERAVIWSFQCAGLGHKRIAKILREGKEEGTGIKSPFDYLLQIPDSSVKSICETNRRKHGSPRAHVPKGKEDEMIDRARRDIIGCLSVQAKDWKVRFGVKGDRATAEEIREGDRILEALDRVQERRLRHQITMKKLTRMLEEPEKLPTRGEIAKSDPKMEEILEAWRATEKAPERNGS